MKKLAIGLMSGTSLDGLDIALVEIDYINNKWLIILKAFEIYPIKIGLKKKIYQAFNQKISTRFLTSLNFELANFFGDSVNHFLLKNDYKNSQIDFIASHGQTIYHLTDPNDDEVFSTLQLGDISVLANITKIQTIGDFRPADIAVGGQGAPLVAYPDYLLFAKVNVIRILQNIGGMANATVLDMNTQQIFAFDNGPGNVLIDFAMQYFYNKAYDEDGQIAQKGKINQKIIDFLSLDIYYAQKPPKSTGREKYSKIFFEKLIEKFPKENAVNWVTTLTYFTAFQIALSYTRFVFQEKQTYEVYVSGGGAKNVFLIQWLKKLLPNILVTNFDTLGLNSDAKEAIAFALLGYLTLESRPGNLPSTTGAKEFAILGKIAKVLT